MIRRVRQTLIVTVVALAVAAGASAQVRDTPTAAQSTLAPSGTAAISGVVMSADSMPRPLRMATVVLIGAMTGVLKVTSTDRDGKFSFTSLPADRYNVGASRAPYLGAVVGARRPARPGTPIVLAAGQKVTDAVIRLPPGAAVSGTVVDELGQPLRGSVTVQQRKLQNGERVLVSVGGGEQTDERGRYRIYGLPPGEYVVVATRSGFVLGNSKQLTDRDVDDAMRGTLSPSSPAVAPARAVPIYYPGTPRPSDAVSVALSAGDDRTGIDFRAESVTTMRVEGTVLTADGQVPTDATVILMPPPGSVMPIAMTARVGPDGRFAIASVPPGAYLLNCASVVPRSQFALMPVELSNADLVGLQVTLRPPMQLTGRVAFDGPSVSPALNGLTVPFKPMMAGVPRSGNTGLIISATDAKGSFAVQGVQAGRYVFGGPMYFGASQMSVTWSLQSVIADGADITDRPIDITPEKAPKEIVVTFTDQWQGVTGKLTRASGTPVTDYTVIVFPADKAYWLTGSRRILTAKPDSSGQFTLAGPGAISLPAGEYLLASVTELDRDEQFDPALLASLVQAAVPISLQPGERKVQDLVIK